jgi:hypothetical protein
MREERGAAKDKLSSFDESKGDAGNRPAPLNPTCQLLSARTHRDNQ